MSRSRPAASSSYSLVEGARGASLFARSSGFRGTTLLRDIENPLRYLAVEFWEREGQREHALANHEAEYTSLETAFAELAKSMTEVGSFRVLAETTVRSRGRAGRAVGGKAARSTHRTTR